MNERLYLGIDGGGSKCHAVLWREGGIIGSAVTGPASTTRDYAGSLESVVAAARAAAEAARIPQDELATATAGIGLAGLNLPGELERIGDWQHPFARACFATDVEIACLGAHAGGDGAVIIAGTGSSACVRVGGQVRFFGGSGFPAGDFGSGASIGLQAVQAVLLAADGLGPATALAARLESHFSARAEAIAGCVLRVSPGAYAALAPLVFGAADEGDAVAGAILRHAADYLGNLVRRLKTFSPPRISIIGGVSVPIADWLDDDVQALLARPLESAAAGAVRLARAGFS